MGARTGSERRRVWLVVVGLLISLLGIQPASASTESSLVAAINAERASHGLPSFAVDGALTAGARAHSQRMLDAGDLYHNPSLGSVTSGWESLGENVGVGPSVDSLHRAFMGSSGHRANVLGDYTHVGVGVVAETDTKLWVTVVFMKAAAPASGETPLPEPESPPSPTPPDPAPATPTPDAGFAPVQEPVAVADRVVHATTDDVSPERPGVADTRNYAI